MPNNFEISTIVDNVISNLTKSENRDLQRLFHGRGGTYENLNFLNADLYPPALFFTLYDFRSEQWKESLSSQLLGIVPIKSVVFQDRTSVPWINSCYGDPLPDKHVVEENGLYFRISLEKGENSGIFPDMGGGRAYLRSISSGKRIVNLFSYTCAFSVSAIAG